MALSDCYLWANEQFGYARLGDPRRTRRLVSLASSLAQHAGLIEQQRWTPTVLSTSEKSIPMKKKKVTAGSRLRSVWPNGWERYRNG